MCSGGLLNLSWVLISSRSKNCLLECLSWEDPPDSRDQGFRIRIRWWRVTRSLKDAKRSSRTSKHPHKHSGDSTFGVDPVQYILHFLNFKGIDLLNNNDLTHLRLQKRRHSDRSREPRPPGTSSHSLCAHLASNTFAGVKTKFPLSWHPIWWSSFRHPAAGKSFSDFAFLLNLQQVWVE